MKPICIFLLLLLVCASIADAQPLKIAALERQVERTKSEKLRLARMVRLPAIPERRDHWSLRASGFLLVFPS
jgi:hypothetical protein